MHETRVAALERVRAAREVVRGHALQHHRGALTRCQSRRQHEQLRRRHAGVLRVRARDAGVRDLVADLDVAHVRAHGGHGAAGFHPECRWQLRLVLAGAEVDVDVVDPGGVDLHDRFARLRRRLRRVFVAKGVGTARRMYANGFHGMPPRMRWCRIPPMASFPIRTARELMDDEFEARWTARERIGAPARATLAAILDRFVADGGPIAIRDLGVAGLDARAVAGAIDELDRADCVALSDGRVVLAYPFASAPTGFVA